MLVGEIFVRRSVSGDNPRV